MSDSYHDVLNDVLMNLSDNAYLRFEVPDEDTGSAALQLTGECGICNQTGEHTATECKCIA